MTVITRNTHTHTTHLLPLQRDVSFFVFGSRQEGLKRWKRGVGRPMGGAGENLTVLINEYLHTNSFKPLTHKVDNGKDEYGE